MIIAHDNTWTAKGNHNCEHIGTPEALVKCSAVCILNYPGSGLATLGRCFGPRLCANVPQHLSRLYA